MSKPPSGLPSSSATPAPSSPPPSESYLSELDGTAPSVLDASTEFGWDPSRDASGLNLVSWKLDVNARSEDGVEKRGFNGGCTSCDGADPIAISTVLNHPTKKANPLRSSRKTLPPLAQPPAPLPKPPPPNHYDGYLKAVTPLYESFLASQAHASTLSQPPLTGDFDSRPPPRSDLPPLTSVPSLFFEKDFDLASPSTWETLAGGSSSSGSSHDALSTHLDTLERHLIHEITLRSTSFFSALSNLQDLHSESSSCLTRISALRNSLKEVGSKEAAKGLEIIDKQEDLRVLRVTEEGIRQVAELEELLRVTRGLVEHGDWSGGLTCLADVVRWWDRHGIKEKPPDPPSEEPSTSPASPESPILPLSTLPALQSLPDAMVELTKGISEQLETALSSLMLSFLSEAESETPFSAERFKDGILPMMSGMARCGHIAAVEGIWRDVVTTGVREGSRKHLPVSNPEEDADDAKPMEMKGANLASALKSLDHMHFLRLSREMYATMLKRLHLAQTMGECIEQVMHQAQSLPALRLASAVPSDAAPPDPVSLDLQDIIASACELANLRASKILSVRSEQHAALQLTSFVEIFKVNWDFVVATETLAKRMIVSLRGATSSQARTFLIAYHSQRLTRSAKLVEEEQWSQIDVSDAVQHVVDLLVQSAVSDPPECFIPPREPVQNGSNEGGSNKVISVEDKNYFVVKATAESLVLLGDYMKIVINLELVVTDVMGRIIEFLKSFNSRTCQVVLGAGAMRSAGLKNITAKHLALASQSLSVIISLIPYIREFIRRHLSQKQAVMLTEFDKLKRDYQEHQNEIHAKLVAIMSDRLSVHVGSMRAIDWEVTPDKDAPRSYAEMLVKETATLHKVLSKYLATSTVETVMIEVLAAVVKRLTEEYTKVELKSEEAKKRMLQDASLVSSKLAALAETDVQLSSLETVVKDKPIPKKPMGEAVKGMFRKTSTSVKEAEKPAASTEEATAKSSLEATGEEEDSVLASEKMTSPRASMERPEPNGKVSSEDVKVSGESARDAPVPAASPLAESTPAIVQPSRPESTPPVLPADTTPAPAPAPEPHNVLLPPSRTSSPLARGPSPAAPTGTFSPSHASSIDIPRRPPSPGIYTSSTPQRAISASPAPSPASPVQERRAPRVSLANRLKGLASRAGSADSENQSPPAGSAEIVVSPTALESKFVDSPIPISGATVAADVPQPPKVPENGGGPQVNGVTPDATAAETTNEVGEAPPPPPKSTNDEVATDLPDPQNSETLPKLTEDKEIAPPPPAKFEDSPKESPKEELPMSANGVNEGKSATSEGNGAADELPSSAKEVDEPSETSEVKVDSA